MKFIKKMIKDYFSDILKYSVHMKKECSQQKKGGYRLKTRNTLVTWKRLNTETPQHGNAPK